MLLVRSFTDCNINVFKMGTTVKKSPAFVDFEILGSRGRFSTDQLTVVVAHEQSEEALEISLIFPKSKRYRFLVTVSPNLVFFLVLSAYAEESIFFEVDLELIELFAVDFISKHLESSHSAHGYGLVDHGHSIGERNQLFECPLVDQLLL